MSVPAPAESADQLTYGAATFTLPIYYYRDDFFLLALTADRDRVAAMLPSPRLHPVRLPGGRTIVVVAAMNYLETSIGPYGEVAVSALVVHGPRAPWTPLPAIRESNCPGFGNLVLHLPVTNRAARDAGRGEWGYRKFVADMDFQITPRFKECRLAEGGRHILTLRVTSRGRLVQERGPLVTYSVRDGELLKTNVVNRGVYRRAWFPRDSLLELGEHPVSESLRALKLSPKPLQARSYLERFGALPAGETVERGLSPWEGRQGGEREGRHSVIHRPR
jgi:hypothetical protein